METKKNDKKEMEASMFKSYYVVWKPYLFLFIYF